MACRAGCSCRKKETDSKQPKTRMKTCPRRDCKGQSVGKVKVKESVSRQSGPDSGIT